MTILCRQSSIWSKWQLSEFRNQSSPKLSQIGVTQVSHLKVLGTLWLLSYTISVFTGVILATLNNTTYFEVVVQDFNNQIQVTVLTYTKIYMLLTSRCKTLKDAVLLAWIIALEPAYFTKDNIMTLKKSWHKK